MSAQKQVPVVKTAEHVFPQVVSTAEQSLVFMHRTLAVCFSSIAYLRNMFRSDTFSTRTWEGCELPILNGNDPRSKRLIKFVKGIFDAMKKGYLRQVILGISCDKTNSEKVVEAYTFRFHYKNSVPSVSLSGQTHSHIFSPIAIESTKGDVVRLIRQMSFFVKSLQNLPSDEAYFTIKLLYYDDITPADYEPPGFEPTKTEDFDFGKRKIVGLDMGKVSTSFHVCRVGVRSTLSGDGDGKENNAVRCAAPLKERHDKTLNDGNDENAAKRQKISHLSFKRKNVV